MNFFEAMEQAAIPLLVKREGWTKQTVRFHEDTKTYVLERHVLNKPADAEAGWRPRIRYEPTTEDMAATDWRLAEVGEEAWS